jgi:hypothetical protein
MWRVNGFFRFRGASGRLSRPNGGKSLAFRQLATFDRRRSTKAVVGGSDALRLIG